MRRPAAVGAPRPVAARDPEARSGRLHRVCADSVAAPVDQVDRQLVEEPGGRVVQRRSPRRAHQRPGDVEPLPGAGHADVGEAALLLQLGLVAQRARVREDAVLEPGEEHDRELQALGRVQRHQRDHAGVVVVGRIGDLVGVGDERHPLQEVAEAGRDQAGVDVCGIGGRTGHRVVGELAGDGDELGEVLDPGRVLRVVGGLELGEVAGALEHGLHDHVGALVGRDHRLRAPRPSPRRPGDRAQRAGGQAGSLLGSAQRLPEGQPLAVGAAPRRRPRRGRRCRALGC